MVLLRPQRLARSKPLGVPARRVPVCQEPDEAEGQEQEGVSEGGPLPDIQHEPERRRDQGGPEDAGENAAAVEVAEARVDERKSPGDPADPGAVDLPQEAVALPDASGASTAPLLLALSLDLAQEAIFVAELEEVFRAQEIHNPSILFARN